MRMPAARVLMALLCLAAYSIAGMGLSPAPGWVGHRAGRMAASIAGDRFPCENAACGCSSARECWTTCLCHTLGERVQWAQANHVAIPSYVRVPSDLRAQAQTADLSRSACPLCSHENTARPAPSQPEHRGKLCLSALGCKGQVPMVAVSTWIPIPHNPPVEVAAPASCGVAAAARFDPPGEPAIEVPAPPPRI